jgi:hypothetical protein
MDVRQLGFVSRGQYKYKNTVAGSTFRFGGLFLLPRGFLLRAIFLVGVGGVVFVILLLGLVEVILVSLVNMSTLLR